MRPRRGSWQRSSRARSTRRWESRARARRGGGEREGVAFGDDRIEGAEVDRCLGGERAQASQRVGEFAPRCAPLHRCGCTDAGELGLDVAASTPQLRISAASSSKCVAEGHEEQAERVGRTDAARRGAAAPAGEEQRGIAHDREVGTGRRRPSGPTARRSVPFVHRGIGVRIVAAARSESIGCYRRASTHDVFCADALPGSQ